MEEAGVWKDWEGRGHLCVELTVLLAKRLNCEVRDRALGGDDCGRRLRVCVEGWQRWALSFPRPNRCHCGGQC